MTQRSEDHDILMNVDFPKGNIVSMVLLAPLPTFYRIFKKKSTEGFQSIPYAVALFSAMLMLYYAFLKGHAFMLITINSIACVIETSYLVIYMVYAPAKIRAPNILGFGFGIAQMIMYLVFKNSKKAVLPQYIIKEIPNGNGVAENDNQLKEEDTNGSKVEDARSESMTSKFEDALLESMTSKFEDATTEPNESVV